MYSCIIVNAVHKNIGFHLALMYVISKVKYSQSKVCYSFFSQANLEYLFARGRLIVTGLFL